MDRPLRVTAVCTGNICRSPIAEVVLRSAVEEAGLGDRVVVDSPAAAAALLPEALGVGGEPFTTRELGAAVGCRMILAQRIAYCLRALEVFEDAGKRGRAPLHRRVV